MAWYVLYTKSRNEKKVARLVNEAGIAAYCPVQEIVRQWSDRKKKVQEPVFRSYIFVHLEDYESESIVVLNIPGAVRFLWWLGKPGVVRDDEIQSIKDFLSRYKDASITSDIKEGQEVIVKEGPLQDKSGIVIRIQGNKAILHLKSLGWNLVAQLPLQSLLQKK